jgi:1A family penicillin-binding protein
MDSLHFRSPQNWRRNNQINRQQNQQLRISRFGNNRRWSLFYYLLSLKPAALNWKNSLLAILAIIATGLIVVVCLVAWYSRSLPNPNRLINRSVAQSSKIFDRTGQHLLYEVHGDQKRTIVPLEQIPKHVVQSAIALEDQKFYEHGGFSISGMVRGVFLRAIQGKRLEGGSTITQQLIKNAVLTNERSVTRKIKELVLAYQLEKRYKKDEILQLYFNEIPYGGAVYGIESAAQTFFGKSVKNLSIAEGAILASLPQAPTYYSPYGPRLNELMKRKDFALEQMVKQKYISQEQADIAKKEKIIFKKKSENMEAPHFVFYVRELLAKQFGDSVLEQDGFNVITTLDYDLQKKAEEIITSQVEKNRALNANNAASITLDVATGQILSMIGSADYFNDDIQGQVNVVTAQRQPGSSIKPLVYLAAFMKGYVPETMVYDLNTVFPSPDKNYQPKNYDGKEHGPISLRQALAGSLNIPAVKMLYLVGLDSVIDLAKAVGYSTIVDKNRYGLSLVLGGAEVSLLEHTNAYATYARNGQYLPVSAILKVTNNKNDKLFEYEQKDLTNVVPENFVQILTSVLSDNSARAFIFGEKNYLTLADRPVATKTGTTNDFHDAWTLGYTPQIATGVWVGNSNNKEMNKGADGSKVAAPIWQKIMQFALQKLPIQDFVKPEYSIPNKPMLGGQATSITVKIDKLSGKLATEFTPAHLIEEKTFQQAHNILFYVDKNDPLGPVPTNPEKDPYFSAWEAPVAKWAKEHNISNEPLPTEYDDIHKAEDKVTVEIKKPLAMTTITNNQINLELNIGHHQNLTRLEAAIDGQTIASQTGSNFSQTSIALPIDINNGVHTLTIKVFDSLENIGSADVTLELNRTNSLSVNWVTPSTSAAYKQKQLPIHLSVYIDKIDQVNKIDFFGQNNNGSPAFWINYVDQLKTNTPEIVWSPNATTGNFKVYPIITLKTGQSIKGPEINISLE